MRVGIPHSLDKAEVRRRLESRMPELANHIPGGFAQVDHAWLGEDRMRLSVGALGQAVVALLDVEERQVVVTVELPPQLAFFGGAVEQAIRNQGTKLLR
ncbi:MAG: polyhydroxyalkanoic acid system family protein [Novosphingobium sp.]|nr:polyhydroxyalkanoic acid system family protein [Novosphingobium sp.]